MNRCLLFLLALVTHISLSAQLRSPDTFLPHALGETFTPHFMLVNYIEHVAANSDRVQMMEYGTTNEGRPLLLCFLSTPANLARLDEIRENNLQRIGLAEGKSDPDLDRAIVWLSYSVHGNEPAGSESSMEVLYQLADPENGRTSAWLENTIVILDPCVNPDGYDRYTHWFRGVATQQVDPALFSREHREPWPGGRTNHYLFDLNRDWAWQTQVESQARIQVYKQWMPHVHADLHEMGLNSPYFFAPAARPFHEYVQDYQARFQKYMGENHARYFDEKGWLYFTRENYDLLYPSYGDTWPTFNGAIGMTYEQGGSEEAGRAVILENGDTLTLRDRIDHHRTTSLSTVEVASARMRELITSFENFYRANLESPRGNYESYAFRVGGARGRLKAFLEILEKNGIQYGRADRDEKVTGWSYADGERKPFSIYEGDILVSARQPRGLLTQVLLDPATKLEDSLTYDLTAWALPYAYGLQGVATAENLAPRIKEFEGWEDQSTTQDLQEEPLAWLVRWESTDHARLLANFLRKGIQVRSAKRGFALERQYFPAGTLVIHQADNKRVKNLNGLMAQWATDHPGAIATAQTGLTERGPDLGSNSFKLIRQPRIGLLSEEGTSANSFGQVWHYLENTLGLPVHILPSRSIGRAPLDKLDILILPEGWYSLGGNAGEELNEWIREGGKLIAIGYANRSLEGANGMALRASDRIDDGMNGTDAQSGGYIAYNRRSASEDIPGAIFRLEMDYSHPLSYGLPNPYFSLKTSNYSPGFLEEGWNVGTIGEKPQYQGFVGYLAYQQIQNSLVFGVQEKGKGHIVYLIDNPLFRGFWEAGKMLFANALFMVD
jgi:hypothetical protein